MMRIRLELIAAALLFVTLIAIVFAWRAERRDAATLRAQLQSAQTSMNQATARQDVRDAQTKKNVATLQHQKAAVQTPAQILQALPTVLPLPTPLTATLIRAPTPLEREVATSANFPAGSSATSSAVG